jgi:hypothetical protein
METVGTPRLSEFSAFCALSTGDPWGRAELFALEMGQESALSQNLDRLQGFFTGGELSSRHPVPRFASAYRAKGHLDLFAPQGGFLLEFFSGLGLQISRHVQLVGAVVLRDHQGLLR